MKGIYNNTNFNSDPLAYFVRRSRWKYIRILILLWLILGFIYLGGGQSDTDRALKYILFYVAFPITGYNLVYRSSLIGPVGFHEKNCIIPLYHLGFEFDIEYEKKYADTSILLGWNFLLFYTIGSVSLMYFFSVFNDIEHELFLSLHSISISFFTSILIFRAYFLDTLYLLTENHLIDTLTLYWEKIKKRDSLNGKIIYILCWGLILFFACFLLWMILSALILNFGSESNLNSIKLLITNVNNTFFTFLKKFIPNYKPLNLASLIFSVFVLSWTVFIVKVRGHKLKYKALETLDRNYELISNRIENIQPTEPILFYYSSLELNRSNKK